MAVETLTHIGLVLFFHGYEWILLHVRHKSRKYFPILQIFSSKSLHRVSFSPLSCRYLFHPLINYGIQLFVKSICSSMCRCSISCYIVEYHLGKTDTMALKLTTEGLRKLYCDNEYNLSIIRWILIRKQGSTFSGTLFSSILFLKAIRLSRQ